MEAPLSRPAQGLERIAQEIRQVMAESLGLRLEASDLGSANHLTEAVAMDSVAVLQFVVALERHFGIRIEEQWLDLDKLGDLAALAAYIEGRRGLARPAAADG